MKWGLTTEQKRIEYEMRKRVKMDREATPRPFYAWRPVRLLDGRYAWLETVMKRYDHIKKGNYESGYWSVARYWAITPTPKPPRQAGDL